MRLLVKNLGRSMPESVVRDELESLNIRVQGVTKPRSDRRDQDPAKDCPPTPQFIISVARGPEVSRVRSLNELCGLRVSVESTWPRKARCNVSAANASATRSATAVTLHGASLVGAPISPVAALPRGNSPTAVATGVTTQRTIVAVLSGRRRGRVLQSKRPTAAERAAPQGNLSLRKPSGQAHLPSRWN